ncbi:GTPase Era [Candidatus Microthrix parvicella]|uniref:GTPase Era n=1 Tax=Candidatus Neomicrothrix parvicella TaxID=41950 RepID=UPI0004BB1BF2|nr:GTPase Era [Candidatus Microthrix parvicella]
MNGTNTMPDHDTDQPAEMRSGFVALAGRPNVGKSSLTNAIVGQKVTIVSPRPQTTRHEIRGMLTRVDAQLVLVDTPGVHKPKTAMGKRLNRTATEAREDTDATVLVVDASKGVGGPGDARLMAAMPDDVIVAINKIDRLPQEQVLAAIKNAAALAKRFEKGAVEIFPISARTNKGVPELTEYLIGLLPPGPLWYPEDQVRDSTEGFWVAELVREQLLATAREELPHSIATRCVELNWPYVEVEILVERISQKGMVIGQGGENLKRAGIGARRLLPEGTHLELKVKVNRDWQRKDAELDKLGY